ncbi:DUF998 domain-containing protein [Actinomyces gaoshouyii]|uniref:DUF998 domain-containing protein n=1 Tax=Actinomyces gaoshouyii TaxID=1960083 RepID=A0A8H9H9G3_9ACTO|nr:DUF998 domain-containing protein [Actinomyces gaoshouyii]GGO94675.1 hypothetical protein GCM10011612_00660 [Actinomyces gaoshouyii]
MSGRILAILAVVLYNTWLAWPLNGSPDALLGYVSELAAADQPFHDFFRAADIAAAAVFAAIALLGRRGWAGWIGARWSQRLCLALLGVAVGTALDAIFNLPCAESRDQACAAVPSMGRRLHEAASVFTSTAQVAMIVIVALALAACRGWNRRVRQVVWLAAVVTVLLLISVAAPYVLPGAQGPVQIVQILLCSLWIAHLAWRLPREQHD